MPNYDPDDWDSEDYEPEPDDGYDDPDYDPETDGFDGRYDPDFCPDFDGSPMEFADPGGVSSLRAASPDNPRIHPCPTCGIENRLTRKDVALGYQCDSCADALERGGY